MKKIIGILLIIMGIGGTGGPFINWDGGNESFGYKIFTFIGSLIFIYIGYRLLKSKS